MNQSTLLILKALLEDSDEITALNGGKFLTTRVSNCIVWLRKNDIKIDTIRVKTNSNKWYGKYKLVQSTENIAKVKKILSSYKDESQGSN
jgi:uncharacterized protein YxjI